MRALGAALLIVGLSALSLPASAETGTALVIGQATYATAGLSSFSKADAAEVALALAADGWRVQAEEDRTAAQLEQALSRFAAGVAPNEAVFVYFSGLSAKGAQGASGVDNILLGVDAAPASQGDLPAAGLPFGRLLAALNKAGAGAKVIVVDAARPNKFEADWLVAPGMAEPTSFALRNAFIALPAQPGKLAREGLFASALARALKQPGVSIGRSLIDLSTALDQQTGGAQSPWFSGSATSARLAPRPGGTQAAGDQQVFDEAVACGTEACLRRAASRVADAGRTMDLRLRAAVAGVEYLPPSHRQAASAAGTPSYVDSFTEANKSSAAGMSLIGHNYLKGDNGFPKDVGQAYVWLTRAATAGDGTANYLTGMFFETGGPPVNRVDRYAAVDHFKVAAALGVPEAQYQLGLYYYRGDAGLSKDPAAGAQWMAKAAAAGNAEAREIVAGRVQP